MNRLPAELEVLSPIATKTDVLTAPVASPLTVKLPDMKADLETPNPPTVVIAALELDVASRLEVNLPTGDTIEFVVTKFPVVVLELILAFTATTDPDALK